MRRDRKIPLLAGLAALAVIGSAAFQWREIYYGLYPEARLLGAWKLLEPEGKGEGSLLVTGVFLNFLEEGRVKATGSGFIKLGRPFSPGVPFVLGKNDNIIILRDLNGDGRPEALLTNDDLKTFPRYRVRGNLLLILDPGRDAVWEALKFRLESEDALVLVNDQGEECRFHRQASEAGPGLNIWQGGNQPRHPWSAWLFERSRSK